MGHEGSIRAREIFAEAAEMAPDARADYLRSACGDDHAIRQHVDVLLTAHDRAGDFISGATVDTGRLFASALAAAEAPGDRLGPYRLLQLIGQGGFGAVYLAQQEHPVRREVALKIIKLGMDTKQVIARFEAERQALAMMDHPNIAKVFDAGATDSGRPYFVMELVRGVPLTEYCDQKNLTTRQRLELFVLVCRAVQHAHQKGLIHRDLKPSNVLVTVQDEGAAVPKVIDFGIAKATGGEGEGRPDRTPVTEHRQLVGTPQYMSPEQAGMGAPDVDTRSDVYSLGVILYELLTGTTPFDVRALRSAAYGEIQRILREVDPPAPSTRLGTLEGKTLTTIAARRRTEPSKLGRLVRGELDWVVMKCLEKDRTRRYDTASALAEDVQRYLRDELVQARPPGWGYRLRKAVRRNKAPIAAAAVVVLSLVLGLSAATAGFLRARDERDRAISAGRREGEQRQEAESSRAAAERARAQAVAVNELLHEAFISANRRRTGDETSLRKSLDEAAAKINAGALKDQPELEAAVRTTIGNTYFSWGYRADAERELRAAMEIRRAIAPPEGTVDLAKSLSDLGWLLHTKGQYDEAVLLLRESLQTRRLLLGSRSPAVADTLHALAVVHLNGGDREKARPLVKESLAIRLSQYDDALTKAPGDVRLLSLRGHVRARAGDFGGSIADYGAAIEAKPDDPWNWFLHASLLLYVADMDGYRDDCREMVKRFASTRSPETAERTAKACLLDPEFAAAGPDATADLATLGVLVDRAVGASVPAVYMQWFQVTKGMYEYRCGRHEEAIGWLLRGRMRMKPQAGRALADFYLAMALHRAGKHDSASMYLADGIRLTPDDPLDVAALDPLDGGSAIGNWLIASVARREAEKFEWGDRRPAPMVSSPPIDPPGESPPDVATRPDADGQDPDGGRGYGAP